MVGAGLGAGLGAEGLVSAMLSKFKFSCHSAQNPAIPSAENESLLFLSCRHLLEKQDANPTKKTSSLTENLMKGREVFIIRFVGIAGVIIVMKGTLSLLFRKIFFSSSI